MTMVAVHTAVMVHVAMAAASPLPTPPCPPMAAATAKHQVLTASRRSGDYGASAPSLMLGQPTDLLLAPAGKVLFAAPLGKPIEADDTGGLIRFRATLGGTYRVALGGHAWIDVAQGTRTIASIAHAPGAPCSGITKMVDFALPAGDYVLQISDTKVASITVTVTQLP